MDSPLIRIVLFLCSCCLCSGASQEIRNDSSPPQHLIITSTYGAGFFSEVLKILDAILHFQEKNLQSIDVDWTEEFFLYKTTQEENGWDLYFEPNLFFKEQNTSEQVAIERWGEGYHEIHDFLCIDQWINYDRYLPYRLKVYDVINKYLKVKQSIASEVEQIYRQNMEGSYCIGVHVRYGSDHSSEAPKGVASLKEYITEVKNLIYQKRFRSVRIYLATDSRYVVEAFRDAFSSEQLITIDTYRTEYRDVPHLVYGNGDYWLAHKEEFHKKKPGYLGGKGVLMDALLLAHCDILIHSTSNIASFVTFYNPYIQSIYLPKDSATWPCRHGKNL